MKALLTVLFAGFGICTAAVGQAAPPQFEVASIKPWTPTGQSTAVMGGLRIDGAQVRMSAMPIRDLLAAAYNVKYYQVSGPEWMTTERYEIAATMPAGSRMNQVPAMLQSLLLDRFQMKLHRDKREFPVYALVVDKGGLKVQPRADDPAAPREPGVSVGFGGSERGVAINLGNGSTYSLGNNRFEVKKFSMSQLASTVERFVDRPVVDETKVSGNFDLGFDVSEEDYRYMMVRAAINSGVVLPPQAMRALETGSIGSLMAELTKVGLRLEPRKAPLDVIVVDELRKTPTDN